MASKEDRAVKYLSVENAQQEDEGGDQAAVQNGEEAQKPGGNARLGWVRRLVPTFRWATSNKRGDHNEVRNNVEKIAMQPMEIKRKTRELQLRQDTQFQTPEPDNHYDFCLIP
ncbi:protein BEX4 [Rhynchonycteris naso]